MQLRPRPPSQLQVDGGVQRLLTTGEFSVAIEGGEGEQVVRAHVSLLPAPGGAPQRTWGGSRPTRRPAAGPWPRCRRPSAASRRAADRFAAPPGRPDPHRPGRRVQLEPGQALARAEGGPHHLLFWPRAHAGLLLLPHPARGCAPRPPQPAAAARAREGRAGPGAVEAGAEGLRSSASLCGKCAHARRSHSPPPSPMRSHARGGPRGRRGRGGVQLRLQQCTAGGRCL
jgi:hypothetical protein